MLIGVYGDSFAKYYVVDSSIDAKFISWVDLLKEKYRVQNFGKPGTSLFYSYELFKKTHKLFDKVIISFPVIVERFMLPKPLLIDKAGRLEQNVIYSAVLEPERFFNTTDRNTSMILDALSKYYVYCYNSNFYNESYRLMTEEAIRLRPDGLFINKNLTSIYVLENEYYNINLKNPPEIDKRTSHLTYKNHVLVSQVVSEWIDTGVFNFDISNFKPNEEYSDYFT